MIALLWRIAIRNLRLYGVKTVIIASLLGAGSYLAVMGLGLLSDVEAAMQRSVVDSIAGHLQVYSKQAKDDLSLFGGSFMGRPDIAVLSDFKPYRDIAMSHPNVDAFIPMGQDMAILGRGNEMDELLDALRQSLKAGEPQFIQARIDQLRFQVQQLETELAERKKISADDTILSAQAEALATVKAPGFLDNLGTSDETKMQFLETRIAPISGEKPPIYLAYLGVDIELYRQNFSKFKIIAGTTLPPNQRGMLINHKVRESSLKILAARLFDRLQKRVVGGGISIRGDAENQRNASDLKRQYAEILANLDRSEAIELASELTSIGLSPTTNSTDLLAQLTSQLVAFLTVDDSNLMTRKAWFYKHIAPRIRLYEISPGDTVTLRSYTRSGYIKSLPLRVYGIYSWEGLEEADLAGSLNMIDLVSFRELYGQMTAASRRELDEMRQQVGIKDIAPNDAEAALFGGNTELTIETRSEPSSNFQAPPLDIKPVIPDTFPPEELQHGLALNAAIRLRNPKLLQQTRQELEHLFQDQGLEARVVDWQSASGIVGQFVKIVRMALVFALLIIFIVGLVIINNSIIASTFHRTREIGTMRAIGAQKNFILGLFLAETAMTGLVGATIGAGLALLTLALLGQVGIPAGNDVVSFLFSGPRLFPKTPWLIACTTPLIVTLIATLASLYAALYAAQVKPAEAMQEKE